MVLILKSKLLMCLVMALKIMVPVQLQPVNNALLAGVDQINGLPI
jgi:hypothetical protein